MWVAMLGAAAWAGAYEDGVDALRSGRTTQALSLLQQAVDAEPARAEAWWELGWARWNAADPAGAAAAWGHVEGDGPWTAEDLTVWREAATVRGRWLAYDGEPEPVVEAPDSEGTLRIVAGGDTMLGSDLRGARGLPEGDGDVVLADVAALLQAGDVTVVNLEGPLADGLPSDKCVDSPVCYAFRTPTRFAGALERAGVDLAQLANNHASDLGHAGQTSTMAALDAVGIAHTGRYADRGSVTRKGKKIALVAAHSGSCCLSVNALDEVRAAVALADQDADLVIFAFHGGAEGADHRHVTGETEYAWGEARGNVRARAHTAVDAGADLVIGSGPHVLRAMEVYRGRLVAYSLGNFVGYRQFGTRGALTGSTVLLDATLADDGAVVSARLHPLRLDPEAVPHPGGPGLEQIAELSAADFPQTGVRSPTTGPCRGGRDGGAGGVPGGAVRGEPAVTGVFDHAAAPGEEPARARRPAGLRAPRPPGLRLRHGPGHRRRRRRRRRGAARRRRGARAVLGAGPGGAQRPGRARARSRRRLGVRDALPPPVAGRRGARAAGAGGAAGRRVGEHGLLAGATPALPARDGRRRGRRPVRVARRGPTRRGRGAQLVARRRCPGAAAERPAPRGRRAVADRAAGGRGSAGSGRGAGGAAAPSRSRGGGLARRLDDRRRRGVHRARRRGGARGRRVGAAAAAAGARGLRGAAGSRRRRRGAGRLRPRGRRGALR
ncbi:MAG: CapA family protein [Myxococcota bacterium]